MPPLPSRNNLNLRSVYGSSHWIPPRQPIPSPRHLGPALSPTSGRGTPVLIFQSYFFDRANLLTGVASHCEQPPSLKAPKGLLNWRRVASRLGSSISTLQTL